MKFVPMILSLFSVIVAVVWGEEVMTQCDDDMDSFCATEANRYCYISVETSKATCGNCFPGFVEWRSRCVSEEKIDIVLFLEEYLPEYVSSLSPQERAELLIEAIQFIANYQNQNPPPPFELGLNMFSADSDEDLKAHLGFDPEATANASAPITFKSLPSEQSDALPSKVDWVEEGIVTSVKDQGRCGCCWAISVVGSIEGAVAIQNDFLQSLSFQQYISCDKRNYGCNGGSLVYALAYNILDVEGIATSNAYAFTDYEGETTNQCNTGTPIAVTVTEASYVIDFNDDLNFEERVQRMKEAVAKGPVSMVMRSGCKLFSNYKRGILTTDDGCECTSSTCADHAVLMVGYDDTSNPPSWKIKNSWGSGWGEDGYVLIAQTQTGNEFGLFGVLTHGVIPDLAFNLTGSVSEGSGEIPSDGKTELDWWAWLLILLLAMIIIYVVISCGIGCLCPRKRRDKHDSA